MKVEVSINIASTPENVWSAITDIRHCTDMITTIIDLEVLHKPENGIVGLKWKEVRKIFGKEASETMWITESDEKSYYYTRAENHNMIYITKMLVEPLENGARLTMAFSGETSSFFTKILSAIMTPLMKKSMADMLLKDLEDIKAYVENQ